MSLVSSIRPSESASNVAKSGDGHGPDPSEAIHAGRATYSVDNTMRIDLLKEAVEETAPERLSNDMSLVWPMLELLNVRGARIHNGPTTYVSFYKPPGEIRRSPTKSIYFTNKLSPRYNDHGNALAREKLNCAILNATNRVIATKGQVKLKGHLGLVEAALPLETTRVQKMMESLKQHQHVVVPYCLTTNFAALARGEEPKDEFVTFLKEMATMWRTTHATIIEDTKCAGGVVSVDLGEGLLADRHSLSAVILYLLCTKYCPSDEAFKMYTKENWRTHMKFLNRLWMYADKEDIPNVLPDGDGESAVLPEKAKVKKFTEAAPPEDGAEESGSSPDEPQEVVKEPEDRELTEDEYMSIEDPDINWVPNGTYRPAETGTPDELYENARMYLDLPASVYFHEKEGENREVPVGARMVVTLTEEEAARLPGVQFSDPMCTNLDALRLAPVVANVVLSQSDADWKASAQTINKVLPIGQQIFDAQRWFEAMSPNSPRDECIAAWTCVWLRWLERNIVERARKFDENISVEITINENGYKPILSWHSLNPNKEAMDKLYKDVCEAAEGRGIYYQANGISLYDQAVVADLLCHEAPLKIKMRFAGATRSVRPWANCVKMEAYAGKQPVASFGSRSTIVGSSTSSQPYPDWLNSNKENLMSASQYLSAILRVSNRLHMTEQCTAGYWVACQLFGGQGLVDKTGFYFLAPLTGLGVGADLTLPKPTFPPPLAYLFTAKNMSSNPVPPAVLAQFQVGKERLLSSAVGWNCVHFTAVQAWHLAQELHPYGFHMARGATASYPRLEIFDGFLTTYESLLSGETGRGTEAASGIPSATAFLCGAIKAMTGLRVPIVIQCRLRYLLHLNSHFGVDFGRLLRDRKLDFNRYVMLLVPLESAYSLCLRLPSVWPGILRGDYVETDAYLETDRRDPMRTWFTFVSNSRHVAQNAGCRSMLDLFTLRVALSEDNVHVVHRHLLTPYSPTGVMNRSYVSRVGTILSSRGHDLGFTTLDIHRSVLLYDGSKIAYSYLRPENQTYAVRLTKGGRPGRRYLHGLSENHVTQPIGRVGGIGHVVRVKCREPVIPEPTRLETAANMMLLAKENVERGAELNRAAASAIDDALASGLVATHPSTELRSIGLVVADTQDKTSQSQREGMIERQEALPPSNADVLASTGMAPPLKKTRVELVQSLPDNLENANTDSTGFREGH